MVDRILPLSVAPAPDKIERVIVGRSEILTPEFEQDLYQAQDADSLAAKFGKDKYYMAYLDFLSKDKDWHRTTGTRSAPTAPFPAGSGRAGSGSSWLRPGADGWAGPWFRGSAGHGIFDAQGRSVPRSSPLDR